MTMFADDRVRPAADRGKVIASRSSLDSPMNPRDDYSTDDSASVVGGCHGFVVLRADEVKDYYRAYGLVGISVLVLVLLAVLVYFVAELLF